MNTAHYNSPLGLIEIVEEENYISIVHFLEEEKLNAENGSNAILQKTITQLDEYFAGKRKIFDLPLRQKGTDFQEKVWTALLDVEYGKVKSYLDISAQLGDKNLTRAVGNANGKNNIAIIVPCHRVIGTNQALTGYAGGLWRKEWLLKHEGYLKNGQMEMF